MAFKLLQRLRIGSRKEFNAEAQPAEPEAKPPWWRGLRRQVAADALPTEPESSPVQKVAVIEGRNYLFGLEWRLIPPTRALVRTLSLAKKEGKVHYIISEMEDIIGLGSRLPKLRGVKYSAALHLASKFSQGGLELYAFVLADQQVAVVALNESRPIPGFDFLGDAEQARSLIEEFLAIQMGQPIRQVGNAGLLEGEETVAPEDLFAAPARSARIKNLPGGAGMQLLMGVGLLVAGGLAGGWYWLDMQRQQVLEENSRLNQPPPDVLYRRSLALAMEALQPAGPQPLEAWVAVAAKLPLVHAGWRLVRVECKLQSCTAQWDRLYGSFSDFMKELPPHALTAEEVQIKNSPLQASILSKHRVEWPSNLLRMEPAQLPGMREGLRQMSDHLQDLSLLGEMKAEMDKPSLFGGEGDVAQLSDPVFQGQWSFTHELGVLMHVQVPAHAVAGTLEINFFSERGEPVQEIKIKGAYYVRADR